MRRAPALLAAFLAVLAAVTMLAPAGRASSTAPQLDEWDFLNLINRERRQQGMAPLAMVGGALDVARSWAGVMAGDGNLRHNPDVVSQMQARYPGWRRVGENVGVGGNVAELDTAFWNSPGHKANVLGDYDYVGVGVRWASNGRLWVAVEFLKNSSPVPWFTRTPVARLSGASDADNAVLVSRRRAAGSAAGVVVARTDVFADGLAGAPLAAVNQGSVLLTPPGDVPGNVVDEAARVLRPGGTVFLLGGPNAISPAVDTAFGQRGLRTERLAGADRYATAVAVAGRVSDRPGGVFLVSGEQFPDAVVAGAAAASRGEPILLVQPGALPAATAAYLGAHSGASRTVVGGPAAVVQGVFQAAGATLRVAGVDRYETAAAVANRFFPTANRVVVSSGGKFTDALAASPEAARLGAAVVLVSPAPTNATYSYVGGQNARWSEALVVGGPDAVTDETVVLLFS
jgi:putative cell wall-binding protein